MPEQLALNGKRICIDPGHPSEVGSGTRGRKLTELGVAWVIAIRLRDILQERGAMVQLTKQAEREYVSNRKRAEIANAFHADLLLRLHCDADAGSGIAVFYPDRQGRDSSGKVGPTANVLSATKRVAPAFHQALIRSLKGTTLKDRGLKSDLFTAVGAKQGALTGSIHSQVPVLLVEMVVLTNLKDEAFVADPDGRNRLALALADGVVGAFA